MDCLDQFKDFQASPVSMAGIGVLWLHVGAHGGWFVTCCSLCSRCCRPVALSLVACLLLLPAQPLCCPSTLHLQLCLQKHPEHVAKIMEAGEGADEAAAASSPAAEADAAAGSSGAGAAAAAATPRPAE